MTLLAAYSFDAGSGSTVADDSGNGHTLTVSSGTYTASGHTNSGFTLTASNVIGASGTVPAVTGSTCTLMAWVKPVSLPASGKNFICGVIESGGSTDFALFTQRGDFGTANVLQADARVSGGLVAANQSALTAGTWVHVALTFDGSNLRLYRNGTLVTTVANSGTLSNGTTLYVAGANASATLDSNVVVDDVRYYNSAEDANISTLMSTPVSGGSTVNATATLTEAATLAASPTQGFAVSAGLTEAVTLAASAVRTAPATATLTEAATFAASGIVSKLPAAPLSEAVTLTASPTLTQNASAVFTESATLTAASGSTINATAALTEAATVAASPVVTRLPSASITEAVTLTAAATRAVTPSAGLTETATLTANATGTFLVTAALSESVTFTAVPTSTTPPVTPASLGLPGNAYIAPTQPNPDVVDEWRAFIFDTVTGDYETELPLAAIPSWGYGLNDPAGGSISIALGGTDGWDKGLLDQYTDNQNWRWSAGVAYNGSILQAGPIVGESYSEGPSTTINFVGIWKLFSRRVVFNPGGDLTSPSAETSDITYSGITPRQLAKALIRDNLIGQGPLPIDLPDDDGPGTLTQTYYGYDLGLVADELTKLTALDGGPEIEFRPYWVDPLHIRWTMRTGAPRLGQLGSPWTYDYGDTGALVGLDKTADASTSSSGVYVRGSGSQRDQIIAYAQDLSAVNAGAPLLLSVDGNHTSETSSDVIGLFATAGVATYKNAIRTYTGTIRMNGCGISMQRTGSPTIGEISVGDTVNAVVFGHRRIPDGTLALRIINIQGNDAMTAKVSFQTTS